MILLDQIPTVIDTAKGISDFGMVAVTAAFFLVLSAVLMISCFRWFKNIINNIVESHNDTMERLLDETRNQNHRLDAIAEGLKPETMLRIKTVSGFAFDLTIERVCRIIKKIREENHIVDREATKNKIRTLLAIEHDDRNSKFDNFTYLGKPLSSFCDDKWIEQVAIVIENEIYHKEGVNNGRAYTNVKAAYDKIRIDFYHKLIK